MDNLNLFVNHVKNNYKNGKNETVDRYLDQNILTEYLFHVREYSPSDVVSILRETADDFQQLIDSHN